MSRRWILTVVTVVALFGAGVDAARAQGNPQFTLTGVVFVEGGAGRAWLQEPTLTQNQIITLRVGDSVGPYRLSKVLDDRIELEGPSGKLTVPLAGVAGPAVAGQPENQPVQRQARQNPPVNENAPAVEQRIDPARQEPLRKHTFSFQQGFGALFNSGR